jgi:hypothetical protein
MLKAFVRSICLFVTRPYAIKIRCLPGRLPGRQTRGLLFQLLEHLLFQLLFQLPEHLLFQLLEHLMFQLPEDLPFQILEFPPLLEGQASSNDPILAWMVSYRLAGIRIS